MNFFRQLMSKYAAAMKKNPLRVKVMTSGTCFLLSDLIRQALEKKQSDKPFNVKRAARMTLIGACVHAPFLHRWFIFLERRFGPQFSISKLAVDQLVGLPLFIATFLTANSLLQGHSLDMVVKKLEHDWLTVVQRGILLWTPAQLINFKLVPLDFRILYMNSVSLFWGTYLSLKGNAHIHKHENINNGHAIDQAKTV
eukprot:TRINITY_DN6816_c0_g1_i1.p1 TRINITY_DN6816_c0_g1~~TRINITY_DN6816_c0_g1_i1.p1  ORF type:complete len:197 (-),score=24.62 TRINITY_DN6816_c0_g1_i1:4-594(-)